MIDFNKEFNRKNTNCWKWDAEGKNADFAMGCADTDFRIAPPIKEALQSKINEEALTYPCSSENTLKAFSEYFKRHYNSNIDPKDIFTPIGTMLGLKIAIESFSEIDDYIIIQSPVFSYFKDTATGINRTVLENNLIYNRVEGMYSINFKELKEMASNPKSKIMIICNPANPIGKAYSENELKQIVDICNKYNIVLIVDEIYSDFTFKEKKHYSIFSFSKELTKNCIMLTGTGKTFNIHGFYTAFFVIPNLFLKEKYLKIMKTYRLDVIDLGMVAAEVAYKSCDEYVINMRNYIEKNIKFVEEFLKNKNIEVKLSSHQGTYLLWLDFLDWNKSSQELDELFKNYGLVMTKGSIFAQQGDGFMRMNIASQLKNVKGALKVIEKVYYKEIKNKN